MTTLPLEYTLRTATTDDMLAIVAMINAANNAETGESDYTLEELHNEWQSEGFDSATDTWVAVHENRILGYEQVFELLSEDHAVIDGYVAPDAVGRGIGTALVQAVEARIRTAAIRPQRKIQATVSGANPWAQALFEGQGYSIIRQFQRMEIQLDTMPKPPVLPQNIDVRCFVPGQDDAATHAAVTEAMVDHWNSSPIPFHEWLRTRVQTEWFDQSLWLLAVENGEIAGVALCRKRDAVGWVNTLAVRRPWRGRGLGMALLQHAFATFYQRGEQRIGLAVDSQSLTGATRVYERAGMHATEQFLFYGKTLVW